MRSVLPNLGNAEAVCLNPGARWGWGGRWLEDGSSTEPAWTENLDIEKHIVYTFVAGRGEEKRLQ
jgi:hypothetical protein